MALVKPAELGEAASGSESSGLVARTGRERQRYEDSGARLVAGCVPRRGAANAGPGGGALALPASSRCFGPRLTAPAQVHPDSRRADGRGGGADGVQPPRRGPHLPQGAQALSHLAVPAGSLSPQEAAARWPACSPHARARRASLSQRGGAYAHAACRAAQGGWETDETAAEAAARESLEEAGVRGDLQARRPAPRDHKARRRPPAPHGFPPFPLPQGLGSLS